MIRFKTCVEEDSKVFAWATRYHDFEKGHWERSKFWMARIISKKRGSILLHAEPRWGANSDSKNLKAHWVLCSVYTIYENVPQSDHLISAWKTRQEIIIVVATISGTLTNYTRHYGKHCTYIAVILRHITWQMVTTVTRFPQYFCELLQPVNIAIWMKT